MKNFVEFKPDSCVDEKAEMALHRSHVEKGYKLHYNGLYYPTMADNWGTPEIQREEVGGRSADFSRGPMWS